MRPKRTSPVQLGTVLSRALAAVGVTEERVSVVFGACGCRRRIAKLNELSDWAYSFLTRQKENEPDVIEKGKKELEEIINKPKV